MKIQQAKIVVVVMTLAGLAVAGGLIWFLALPTFRDVRELADLVIETETELQAQYANRKNLLSSLTRIDRAKSIMHDLDDQFVPIGNELDFITAVELAAETSGVELRINLNPASKGQAGDLTRTVDLQLSGPYRNILDALSAVERLRYLVIIRSVSIQAGDGGMATMSINGAIASPPQPL